MPKYKTQALKSETTVKSETHGSKKNLGRRGSTLSFESVSISGESQKQHEAEEASKERPDDELER